MKETTTAVDIWLERMEANDESYTDSAIASMIRFAELHVQAALKAASEKANWAASGEVGAIYDVWIDKETILNSYPLTLIK